MVFLFCLFYFFFYFIFLFSLLYSFIYFIYLFSSYFIYLFIYLFFIFIFYSILFYLFIYLFIFFFFLGGGSNGYKEITMIHTLVVLSFFKNERKNETEHPYSPCTQLGKGRVYFYQVTTSHDIDRAILRACLFGSKFQQFLCYQWVGLITNMDIHTSYNSAHTG